MLYYILIVLLSLFIGFMLRGLLGRKQNYFGAIVVTENEGITLYSLELKGEPEDIKNEKEVTFEVMIPTEESDRE